MNTLRVALKRSGTTLPSSRASLRTAPVPDAVDVLRPPVDRGGTVRPVAALLPRGGGHTP
ncbi:hypothetical protein GCM10010271_21100 [Streptomyces kurssanovii]|nr:hypothetical protein GCM10010271_21100 [Streptomyces kurssanovii]